MSRDAAMSRVSAEAMDALASLLLYPGDDYDARIRAVEGALEGDASGVAEAAAPFLAWAKATAPFDREEAYARTFDWSTTSCLDLGWHLFGEQYERGAFLADLRGRYRAAGVEEGQELPDHLSTCLRWLPRGESEDAARTARLAFLPAVQKALASLEKEQSPWAPIVAAAKRAIEAFAADAPPGGEPCRP